MSSRAIDENLNDLSSQVFPCCQQLKEKPVLTSGKEELFPCCPEQSCPITANGVAVDGNTTAPLNDLVSTVSPGTFTMDSVSIAQGATNQYFEVKILAPNGSVTITAVSYSGDTTSVAPAVPIYIPQFNAQSLIALFDTTNVGVFLITIEVTTACGTVVFEQPYEIV